MKKSGEASRFWGRPWGRRSTPESGGGILTRGNAGNEGSQKKGYVRRTAKGRLGKITKGVFLCRGGLRGKKRIPIPWGESKERGERGSELNKTERRCP